MGALVASLQCACSATAPSPQAAPIQEQAQAPRPGRVRPTLALPQPGDFDFGGGRRVSGRNRAPVAESETPEPTTGRDLAAVEPTLSARRASDLTTEDRSRLATLVPGAVAAHGIRVTWEALSVEREQAANPRLGRRPQQGVVADSKIVLVSDDHPAAFGRQKGRATTRESDGSQIAVLAAEDMQLLVKGLREAGFFKVSSPTDGMAMLFEDAEARGRVTVEVDGVSRTVLSLRGQGTQGSTRDVPRIYSQAKQAVAAVRNQTPALSVVTSGGQPIKPRPRLSTGKSRTLTPEEAAAILGEATPAKPVDDDWGLGK